MAKKLEIVGKVWVLDKCIECPLLDSGAMCVIDNKHRPQFDEECENCPLPDATEAPADVWPDDETHRLGPNGERLIAVASVPTSGNSILQFCAVCFCFKHGLPCFPCEKEQREDGRNIHWELAGDRT